MATLGGVCRAGEALAGTPGRYVVPGSAGLPADALARVPGDGTEGGRCAQRPSTSHRRHRVPARERPHGPRHPPDGAPRCPDAERRFHGSHFLALDPIMLVAGRFGEGKPVARPPKSIAEIERLSALGPTDRKDTIRREGRRLTLETLAFLVRECLRDGDTELLEIVAAHLLESSRAIAESVSQVLPPDDREDVHSEASRRMFVSLQSATSETPTFWEERFGHAYKRRCIDVVRAHRKKLERATVSVHDVPEDSSRLDEIDLSTEIAGRIDRDALQQIISELPPREAAAVTLRWIEDKKVSGPGSVSEIMGISPSMVHRHLRNARERLKKIERVRALLGL